MTPAPQASGSTADTPSRKYRYVGPAYPRLNFPTRRIAFRPATVTDAEIDRYLERAPELARYFEQVAP